MKKYSGVSLGFWLLTILKWHCTSDVCSLEFIRLLLWYQCRKRWRARGGRTQTQEKYRSTLRHFPKPGSFTPPTHRPATGLPDVPLAGNEWPVELLFLLGCESQPSGTGRGKTRNLGLAFVLSLFPVGSNQGRRLQAALFAFSVSCMHIVK